MQLDKFFNFLEDEINLYSLWEDSNCFKPRKGGEPYSIMMPPPNVTGSLHMGHALTFTIQDILIRYHRMKGMEVLWQAGTDHAGIATQMVVERKLANQNIDRRSLGREKFIEKVWEWKNESGGQISNQLKRLGASADWSRERFTMDDGLSNAVKKVFVQLFNDKIIYKDKRLVNWDPKLLTAISDLEVEQKEVEGSIWHIKYPTENNDFITIATTRPETMLGDTAVAVHPEDSKYKKYIGKTCTVPIINKKIPIIADEYADPEKGSGAVKITPAHDFNDFEVGKRHNLEFINIFDEFANLNENTPKEFHNLDRFSARKIILEKLDQMSLLVKEEKQEMVIPYGDRSGVVIEPWLTDQWFCDAKNLSIDPIDAVKKGKTNFVPKQWENTFFNWMENIQPWCISRQLWWGHQIPAWYGPDKKFFVSETIEDAKKQALEFYGKNVDLEQDSDVLDTWFSSALWTFSTLDWPEKSYELDRFFPGKVLVTGFDIIFFWVARMMMMGSYFMKETPFKDIYIHPLIRDDKGQKMSKSKGNIIDPLDLLDKYGADTLRFTLTALLNPGRDVKLSEDRVKGYKSFINKIWNAGKFLQINETIFEDSLDFQNIHFESNKWIIKEIDDLQIQIENLTKKYLFHEVANKIYHFVWHTYCDWYIELIKINFNNKKYSDEIRKTSGWSFIQILKIIHPIMPYISEKLWRSLVNSNSFLMNQTYENKNFGKNFNNSKKNINLLIELITSIRNLRSELNIPYKKLIDLTIECKDERLTNFLSKNTSEINNFLKTNKISFDKIHPDKNTALIVLNSFSILIPLLGIVDSKSEIKKLNAKKELEQVKFAKINEKLNNDNFMNKASKEIIEKFKNDAQNHKSSIEKIDQIINTIN
ncbi:valine--tRNA ligase [Pelagibacteraceae bacterium]|nr:valine--tRNA ligase [Pelagibacteraceae bacterium]